MRYATVIVLVAVLAAPAWAQMGNADADRAAVEREESAAIGAAIVRNLQDAQALPEDVSAVYSLSKLDDAVLLELKKRKSLKVLHFSLWASADTWITDSSLKVISTFPCLESLTIRLQSQISGVGFSSLAALKQLKVLRIDGATAGLGAAAFDKFKKHPALQELEVRVELSPDLFKSLANIPELATLKLSSVSANADALKGIDKCKKLEALTLVGGMLPDSALKELSRVKALKSLRLEGQVLKEWSDAAFEVIGKLKGLERLELAAEYRTGSFTPKGLKQLHALKTLTHLGIERDFSGVLTVDMLKELLAGFDNLTGLKLGGMYTLDLDVVRAVPAPEKLKHLTFHCGQITDDSFKGVLASCTALETLDIHANGLTADAFEEALRAAAALKEVSYYESGRVLSGAVNRLKSERPDLKFRRIE